MLVIEDDEHVRSAIREACELVGYSVDELADGSDAIGRVEVLDPDLVLLDVTLPDRTGLDVCRLLRDAGFGMPIVFISGGPDEGDIVRGLGVGADDYMVKPVRPRELIARINAHLRKAMLARSIEHERVGFLVYRDFVIDTETRTVHSGSTEAALTVMEFDLFAHFTANDGRVLSRDRLLASVWGVDRPIATRVVDAHVRNLRRKIEPDPHRPRYIVSVPGIGYRFAALGKSVVPSRGYTQGCVLPSHVAGARARQ